jgi:hypothetical protein
MSKVVLTTDGSLAPSSLIGNSVATGNTTITGTFFANQFTSNSRVTVKDSIYVNTATEVNGAITSSFVIINTTSISVGNVTSNTTLTNNSLYTRNVFIGSNVTVNTTLFLIGDSSANNRISQNNIIIQANDIVNSVSNASLLKLSNNSINSTLTYNSLIMGNTTVNSTILSTGAGVFTANDISLNANGIVVNSSGAFVTNTSGVVNAAVHQVGTSFTANSTLVNTAAINIIGQTNTATLFVITSANIASSNVIANTSGLFVANATGIVNAATHSVGTAFTANATLVNAAAVNIVGQTNTSTLFVTTSANIASSNVIANTSGLFVANATGIVNAATHSVGTSFTANSTLVTAAAVNIVGQTNTATLFVTTSANIASSNIIANSAGLFVANATGIVNAAVHQVGTSFTANSTLVNAVSYYAGTTLIGNTIGPYGKLEINLNVNNALTANNSTYLNGQLASYYLNATNINAGTLAWAHAPVGTVNTTGSFTLSGNTTLAGTNTVISSNINVTGAFINVGALVNTAAINVRGQTNTNTLFVNSVANISGNSTISGNWANVTGDLFVRGNLTVNGSLTYVGNAAGDIIPPSNSFSLGNTSNRWGFYGVVIDNIGNTTSNNVNVTLTVNAANHTVGSDFIANSTGVYHTGLVNAASYRAGNFTTGTGGSIQNTTTMFVGNNTINTVITSAGLNINSVTIANSSGLYTDTVNASIIRTGGGFNTLANGVYIDSDDIWFGNSSVSATVNSTFYSKTANNTSFVGSVSAVNVVSNAQLSANLTNYAALAGATFTGAVQVSNNVTITGNLIVSGTTVSVNTQTLDVRDLNITVAKGVGTAALANGAGLTVDTAGIGWYYHNTSNTWQSNVGITPSSNNSYSLGTTGLRWSALFTNNITATTITATNVSSTDVYGTVRTATQGTIDHNSLANYDANRHVDHTAVSITAGNGLTGGGTIAATRTLSVVGANGILVTAAGINVFGNTGIVSNSSGVFANATYIQSLVNISNSSVTTSGTSAQNIDSFTKAGFAGAEYLINVSDNSANNKYTTKVLVVHDGTNADITEYAAITSNNSVGVFSATQNTTHVILQFTPSLTATTVKYTRTVV